MSNKEIRSSMLSDVDIKKYFGNEIDIYTDDKTGVPQFDIDKQVQLASIDLRFRHECKRFKHNLNGNLSYQRLKNHDYTDPFEVSNNEKLIIQPGEVILTTTMETVVISNQFAGIITGRSSIARLGIMVHCCQEFINPGQRAPIALQITNLGKYPVELDVNVPICQLILFKLSSPSSKGYNELDKSKYKNEHSPMLSQIYKEDGHNDTCEESDTPPQQSDVKQKTKYWLRVCKKYIAPFLPPTIMFLIFTPLLLLSQTTSIASFVDKLKNFYIGPIIAILAIVLYIICRRDEEQ